MSLVGCQRIGLGGDGTVIKNPAVPPQTLFRFQANVILKIKSVRQRGPVAAAETILTHVMPPLLPHFAWNWNSCKEIRFAEGLVRD